MLLGQYQSRKADIKLNYCNVPIEPNAHVILYLGATLKIS